MKDKFFRVARTYKPQEPVMRTHALPNGKTVGTVRRDVYERALAKASKVLRGRPEHDYS